MLHSSAFRDDGRNLWNPTRCANAVTVMAARWLKALAQLILNDALHDARVQVFVLLLLRRRTLLLPVRQLLVQLLRRRALLLLQAPLSLPRREGRGGRRRRRRSPLPLRCSPHP